LPLAARAQQPVRTARIGLLTTALDDAFNGPGYPAILDQLKKSGFSVGQNLTLETVRVDQDPQSLFAETANLVRSNVDLLISVGPKIGLQAATAAGRSVPIVIFAINYDPIAEGYVKSLAQPGGNVTGMVSQQTELAAKQVELLTEALPGRSRLAVLWDELSADQFAAAERQAIALRLDVQSLKLERPPYDFNVAFQSLAKLSPEMLLVLSSPYFPRSRVQIAQLAMEQRLPTMFIFKYYVEAGGMISYGVDATAIYRQLGIYVAKILNGAKPADLPVEQATKFELVVNLKTAKTIGVELSTAIQLRANEVIE
jgi:putative ABC transport system substrate-binding protein